MKFQEDYLDEHGTPQRGSHEYCIIYITITSAGIPIRKFKAETKHRL
jgi:hypothetical protein